MTYDHKMRQSVTGFFVSILVIALISIPQPAWPHDEEELGPIPRQVLGLVTKFFQWVLPKLRDAIGGLDLDKYPELKGIYDNIVKDVVKINLGMKNWAQFRQWLSGLLGRLSKLAKFAGMLGKWGLIITDLYTYGKDLIDNIDYFLQEPTALNLLIPICIGFKGLGVIISDACLLGWLGCIILSGLLYLGETLGEHLAEKHVRADLPNDVYVRAASPRYVHSGDTFTVNLIVNPYIDTKGLTVTEILPQGIELVSATPNPSNIEKVHSYTKVEWLFTDVGYQPITIDYDASIVMSTPDFGIYLPALGWVDSIDNSDALHWSVADGDQEIYIAGLTMGGVIFSVDKIDLLAPYIGLTSIILVATVATAIYVKHVKCRKEK